jgi:hypothetical protein
VGLSETCQLAEHGAAANLSTTLYSGRSAHIPNFVQENTMVLGTEPP